MDPLLDIQNVSISVLGKQLVDRCSMQVWSGKTTALVGESGSGKTLTAQAITRLVPEMCVTGSIYFEGVNIATYSDTQLCSTRGNTITYVFQEPMTALNPLHRVDKQIAELLVTHNYQYDHKQRIVDLLAMVGLDATIIKNRFAHQLSGGQRQRVMIAMALANHPRLLIADEPTTALDQHIRLEILHLLSELQKKHQLGLLLVSHDLQLVEKFADHVVIMEKGRVIEQGEKKHIFASPHHSYTKNLLQPIAVQKVSSSVSTSPLLRVEGLSIRYPIKRGLLQRCVGYDSIVVDLSFTVAKGRTLGLVGPSGSGKSSIALALLQLVPYKGAVYFHNKALHKCNRTAMRPLRRNMQIVFQDPFSSLNPRLNIGQILAEGLHLHLSQSKQYIKIRSQEALVQVGLSQDILNRYPHQFSGGQRQRIALARVIVLQPALLILDEPTSSLDKNNQRNILTLLVDLQKKLQLSYLFISHDLDAVQAVSHEIISL